MTSDRTPHDALLLEIADTGKRGKFAAFVSVAHAELRDAGLIDVTGSGPIRAVCTSEGLDVAREIEGEGA